MQLGGGVGRGHQGRHRGQLVAEVVGDEQRRVAEVLDLAGQRGPVLTAGRRVGLARRTGTCADGPSALPARLSCRCPTALHERAARAARNNLWPRWINCSSCRSTTPSSTSSSIAGPRLAERAELDERRRRAGPGRAPTRTRRQTPARRGGPRPEAARGRGGLASRTRWPRVHDQLYGGTVTSPRELQALQDDENALKRHQSAVEDKVIEQMELAVPLDERLAELAARRPSSRPTSTAVGRRAGRRPRPRSTASWPAVAAERASMRPRARRRPARPLRDAAPRPGRDRRRPAGRHQLRWLPPHACRRSSSTASATSPATWWCCARSAGACSCTEMLLWYLGVSVAFVWNVFRSPALDYRLVMLGSVLPLVEAVFGGPRVLHSLLFSVVLLARGHAGHPAPPPAAPAADQPAHRADGRAGARRVVDRQGRVLVAVLRLGASPAAGCPSCSAARRCSIVLELIGLAALVWCWRAFGLVRPRQPPPVRAHRSPQPGRGAMSRLVVVRHGRTEANAGRPLLGGSTSPSTTLGRRPGRRRSVAAVGPVDRVVTSPLLRTRQTPAGFDAPVVDRRAAHRARLRRLRRHGRWPTCPPRCGGSGARIPTSPRRAASRWPRCGPGSRTALDELAAAARTETVVVVAHVSPIKAAVTWALGRGRRGRRGGCSCSPASITRIGVGETGDRSCTRSTRWPTSSALTDLIERRCRGRGRDHSSRETGVRRGGPGRVVRSEEGTVHPGFSGPPRRVGLVWTPVVPSLQHPLIRATAPSDPVLSAMSRPAHAQRSDRPTPPTHPPNAPRICALHRPCHGQVHDFGEGSVPPGDLTRSCAADQL